MNDIEKKFFETFEISKSRRLWTFKEEFKNYYPALTDRRLLQLMCLIISIKSCDLEYSFGIDYKDYSTLKYCIITTAIAYKNKIRQEVQALFKELE